MTTRDHREPTLEVVDKRERDLRAATLLLLAILAVVTILSFAFLIEPVGLAGGGRLPRVAALGGLFLLTGLFCVYAIQAHGKAARIRRLYQERALKDPLTGLLNRQSLADRFENEVARVRRMGGSFPVLLCDLDNFKQVNDSRGHPFGDDILRQVAQSTLDSTRGSDVVFRWGGDEFLVILSHASREGALIAARRIRRAVQAIGERHKLALDLSVGIAFYPDHGLDTGSVIALADRALYLSKGDSDKIHVGEHHCEVSERSVEIVLQPVVEIGSREVVGYEAFSRDPSGELTIEKLFQRYDAVGRLVELKRFIFLQQVERAAPSGLERVFIKVDFPTLRDAERVTKPSGAEIVLEISEIEAPSDEEAYLEQIGIWRDLGYKFAFRDFGRGFRSWHFIARLDPEYIKVSRDMLLKATGSPQFARFLRDLLVAMRSYSKEGIIVEGVESEEELAVAKLIGADQAQGYLTGRPRRPADLESP